MKTQTAEETLEQAADRELSYIHDVCSKNIDFVSGFRSGFLLGSNWREQKHTTTQIEALRERLLDTLGDNFDFEPIDQTINNFLKEINDGK